MTNPVRILIAIVVTVLGGNAFAASLTCEGLFERKRMFPKIVQVLEPAKTKNDLPFPRMADVKVRSQEVVQASRTTKTEYWKSGPYVVKQIDVIYSEFTRIKYDYEHHNVTITKADRAVRGRDQVPSMKMQPNASQTRIDPQVRREIAREIFDNLSFVLKAYKDEKGWPREFLKKLVQVAFQYAEYSTYVTVRSNAGEIIGSVRIIQTPFLNKERPHSRNERWDDSSLFSELRVKASDLPNPILWREIFGSEDIHLTDLKTPMTESQDGVALIPAPFEDVLGRRYFRDNGSGLGSVVEPGNFAVLRNRELPIELRNVASSTLYYHLARLVRPEAGTRALPNFIGTYASVGSTSDRFYQSLGFKVRETLPPKSANNPTSEPWNVLMAETDGLSKALIIRLKLEDGYSPGTLGRHYFSSFDKFETETPFPR